MNKIIVNFGGGIALLDQYRKEASVRFSLSPKTSERRSEALVRNGQLIDSVGGDSYGC